MNASEKQIDAHTGSELVMDDNPPVDVKSRCSFLRDPACLNTFEHFDLTTSLTS